MKRLILTIAIFASVSSFQIRMANAQQSTTDSLVERITLLEADHDNTKTDIELIQRLKISGYVQAQWQLADTAGIKSFSGGNFPTTSDNRFNVRRGRIKFTYNNENSLYVLQLDATEKGMGIKDAYVAIKEPWAEFATLTAGVFDRPFGYEIGYSSGSRETPERARAFQSLFPGERDLGAKITLQPRKGTTYDFIKLDAGLFAGNGINSEFDSRKDFIGHLSIAKTNIAQTFKYGLGISYYNGGVFQGTKAAYSMNELSDGITMGFIADSAAGNKNAFAKREYMGADAQASIQSAIGITTLRAEYLWGKQPGSNSSNVSISSATAPTYDTYNRNFAAGYIYFIQNIGDTKNQFVLKYDWYDPNTEVSGNEIKTKVSIADNVVKTNLSAGDIMFSTLGLGWTYKFNSQVKFVAYYEIVKNESTGITGSNSTNDYTKDLNDNVFTLRVQYKF